MLLRHRLLVLLVAAISVAGAMVLGRRETAVAPQASVVTPADVSNATIVTAQPAPPAPLDSAALDADLAERYAILLDELMPHLRTQVKHTLALRGGLDEQSDTAIEAERVLSQLLDAEQYALHELLRDSEHEQAYVQAFARSLDDELALTEEQQHALLLARLVDLYAKQALELQAGVPRDDLSAMEQGYVRDIALQGMAHYREKFFEAARAVLTAEQWRELNEFEPASPPPP